MGGIRVSVKGIEDHLGRGILRKAHGFGRGRDAGDDPVFDSLAPTILENVAGHPGRKFVDFGLFNNNKGADKWLLWCDAASNRKVLKVRSYFAFIKLHHATTGIPVGPHIASTENLLTSYSYNGTQKRWLYTKGNAEGFLTNGETRVNGALVPSTYVWPETTDCYLLSQVGPYLSDSDSRVKYDNFGNAAGFHSIAEGHSPQPGTSATDARYVNGDRVGGPIIGEILCYDRCVTDTERRRIEAYLRAKWQGVELRTDLTADDVDVAKESGALMIERNSGVFTNLVTLGAGASLSVDQNKALPPLSIVSGLSASVATGAVEVSSGTSGAFNVSGMGALTVGAVDAGLRRLTSSGVDLCFLSTGAWLDVVTHDGFFAQQIAVANGDFEEDAIDVNSGCWKNMVPTGWTGNLASDKCTLLAAKDTLFHDSTLTGPVPSGDKFITLAASDNYSPKNSELSQSFTVDEAGIYGIRLWYAARNTNDKTRAHDKSPYPTRLQLEVDGTNCVDFEVGYDMRNTDSITNWETMTTAVKTCLAFSQFLEYEFPTPPLAPGSHTLVVRQVSKGSWASVGFLDNIRIVPRHRGEYAWLPDASFDSWGSMRETDNNNRDEYGFNASFSTSQPSAWRNKNGTIASSASGLNQDSRFWWLGKNGARTNELTRLIYHRTAYMLNDTTISNTVTFAKSGTYTFSVDYARTDWGAKVMDHTCSIWLEDPTTGAQVVDLGKIAPRELTMTTHEKVFTLESAGSYRIVFHNTDLPAGTAGGDSGRGTILDEVLFRYGSDFKPLPYEYRHGFTAKSIARDGELTLPVTLEKDGSYRLKLTLAGRSLELTKTEGRCHGYQYYPQAIDVRFDDAAVGRLVVDEPEDVAFALRVPNLTAGNHTVTLISDASATATNAVSTLKAIGFERLTDEEVRAMDLQNVSVQLEDGAKMVIDEPGVRVVRGFVVDGERLTGDVSAANCSAITGRGTLRIVPSGLLLMVR